MIQLNLDYSDRKEERLAVLAKRDQSDSIEKMLAAFLHLTWKRPE